MLRVNEWILVALTRAKSNCVLGKKKNKKKERRVCHK